MTQTPGRPSPFVFTVILYSVSVNSFRKFQICVAQEEFTGHLSTLHLPVPLCLCEKFKIKENGETSNETVIY